ncbi:MAG TPA: energy transducer TonB [Geothrix sp.]|nr:energy transducer TonB [Geothrix sp.]
MDQTLPAIFDAPQPRTPRAPQPSLEDLVYRSTLLTEDSPLRRGDRKKVLGLSVAVYGSLGAAILLLGLQSAVAVAAAPKTVTISLLEEMAELPPPPPPPAGAPAVQTQAGATAQIPQEPLPTAVLTPSLPQAATAATGGAPSQGAGVPGGVAGGVAGGTVGGTIGGTVGATLPPRFDAAYLQNPAPEYPNLSRRLGEEGRTLLRVLISPEGLPRDIQLQASSGYARLDQAALQTVRKWRFVPAMRGSEALSAWVLVPIRFNLES